MENVDINFLSISLNYGHVWECYLEKANGIINWMERKMNYEKARVRILPIFNKP